MAVAKYLWYILVYGEMAIHWANYVTQSHQCISININTLSTNLKLFIYLTDNKTYNDSNLIELYAYSFVLYYLIMIVSAFLNQRKATETMLGFCWLYICLFEWIVDQYLISHEFDDIYMVRIYVPIKNKK